MKIEAWLTTERDGTEYYWYVTGHFSKYEPAQVRGKPENCYPMEGGELEKIELELVEVWPFAGTAIKPLYYHHCHPERPTDADAEVALWEQYEKSRNLNSRYNSLKLRRCSLLYA